MLYEVYIRAAIVKTRILEYAENPIIE